MPVLDDAQVKWFDTHHPALGDGEWADSPPKCADCHGATVPCQVRQALEKYEKEIVGWKDYATRAQLDLDRQVKAERERQEELYTKIGRATIHRLLWDR